MADVVTRWEAGEFAARIVAWQRRAGRHDLPWQHTRDPYRVWLSEIMLQQTQVATVIPYFGRFVQRFPDVRALAAAEQSEVLALWSGLGYYARARNLHACAKAVVSRHGGTFPMTAAELERLPGIGRSTAAAIAAFCFGERVAILDGNVKRVLARVFGVVESLDGTAAKRRLWQRASALLPLERPREAMPAYTQGLMDLGATVCTRSAPKCAVCQLRDRCVAALEGDPARYPVRTLRPPRQEMVLWLLWARDSAGRAWLAQRPASGIWARLHCLPGFPGKAELLAALPEGVRASAAEITCLTHGLTHRILEIHVVAARCPANLQPRLPGDWFDDRAWPALGLPAPIRRFLAARVPGADALV